MMQITGSSIVILSECIDHAAEVHGGAVQTVLYIQRFVEAVSRLFTAP